MPELRVAIAQTNPTVGDLEGNVRRLIEWARTASEQGADVLLTGELALSGYPIEDLALRDNFLLQCREAIHWFATTLVDEGLGGLVVVVGHPDGPFPPPREHYNPAHPQQAHNSVSVIQHGKVVGRYNKHHLPNYAVFDEFRTFLPGSDHLIVRVGDVDCGIVICEDLWRDTGPVETYAALPIGVLLVPNASPFERDKDEVRLPLVTTRAQQMGATVVYTNLVGGQDDLVFDGDSVVVDQAGEVLARLPIFEEALQVVTLNVPEATDYPLPEKTSLVVVDKTGQTPSTPPVRHISADRDDHDRLWGALVLGLRDYVEKNGFPGVLLGLSGGIDSAVCATLATDALGPHRVFGVSLPSQYSSDHSKDDAKQLAETLGIHYRVEPISALVTPFDEQLGLDGVAAENVQARVRGVILMSISNMEGQLVLTTGNKSELAVGYSTIYGDSVGGFAPIKDVPKTLVWELAKWRNEQAVSHGEVPPIPESSITKPPSAELRPGQTDQDSLPDYDVLDQILHLFVVEALDLPQIVAKGFDQETVQRVISLVDRAEWKRRQGAIGPRISSVSFGRDRRLPVTARTPKSPQG